MLAESYIGLPHVLNVMIEWLHVAGILYILHVFPKQ